jgi:peptidoglycan/LPS O-acetylase OafA/YrhL
MDSTARPRLDALTGLRYVAALSVFLTHTGSVIPSEVVQKYTHPLYALGMPLFFVLSGFLMAYNYSASFGASYRKTLKTFYVARLARLYPVYLVCLLLYFSFVGNFFHDLRDRTGDTVKSLAYVGTMTQSWVHIPVFTDTHAPRTVAVSYMGPAWSVSVELFFYALFPFVILPLARFVTGPGRLFVGCGVVFAGYLGLDAYLASQTPPDLGGFWHSRNRWLTYWCPYVRLGEFLIGVMVGQYFLRTADRPVSSRGWWVWAAAVAVSVASLVRLDYFVFDPNHGFRPRNGSVALMFAAWNVLYAPLIAVVIFYLAKVPSGVQRALGCRLMILLGEMSYCMYLLHPLVQSWYYPRSGGEGPMSRWYVVAYNNAAMIAVMHFVCLGLYRYVEVPMRSRIRNWLDPRPKPELKVVRPEGEPIRQAA